MTNRIRCPTCDSASCLNFYKCKLEHRGREALERDAAGMSEPTPCIDCRKPVKFIELRCDECAKQTREEWFASREADPGTTHLEGCWRDGPKHYLCAVERVKHLEAAQRHLFGKADAAVQMLRSAVNDVSPPPGIAARALATLAHHWHGTDHGTWCSHCKKDYLEWIRERNTDCPGEGAKT